jgi:FkbM family methyltransferase
VLSATTVAFTFRKSQRPVLVPPGIYMREVARSALAAALHKLNTVKCGHRIADSRFASWVCGQGVVVANLRYGAQAVVFANDYVGRTMYLWGEHDPRITAVMNAVLRTGDTVLDIGANFGVTGLFAARRVGASGAVHLFEPQPLLAQCLRTSLLINGYSNSTVHECALSDHTGWAEMRIMDPSNWGMTTLSPPKPDIKPDLARRIRVRMENAGDYLASTGSVGVALIKIDIEGHEAVVLSSMQRWLAERARSAIILFECHLDGREFFQYDSVRTLSELGYQFLAYDLKQFWRTRLYALNSTTKYPAGYDFIAVRWEELDGDRRRALGKMMAGTDGRRSDDTAPVQTTLVHPGSQRR